MTVISRLDTGRLILTPQNPYRLPDHPDEILKRLQKIGLIDVPLKPHSDAYLLGDQFMQLINFLGCSPYIQLKPNETGEPFCYLRLEGPYPHPKPIYGRNTNPPRCEACRKRVDNWQHSFKRFDEHRQKACCPHCGHLQDPATYDFRQSAGCGRLFLFIENIFPQEAIPSPALLKNLEEVSQNQPWRYFYQQR
jgi:hypothetical protein